MRDPHDQGGDAVGRSSAAAAARRPAEELAGALRREREEKFFRAYEEIGDRLNAATEPLIDVVEIGASGFGRPSSERGAELRRLGREYYENADAGTRKLIDHLRAVRAAARLARHEREGNSPEKSRNPVASDGAHSGAGAFVECVRDGDQRLLLVRIPDPGPVDHERLDDDRESGNDGRDVLIFHAANLLCDGFTVDVTVRRMP